MTIAKLGALAFAAASVKSAIDFNRSFTQIAAITNTTAGEIDGMKATVLSLAGETAVAPNELAHAMYFLASAGLDTAQQMTSLDAVARGVAVGLGDAGDLARITANALNVFADNGLTATDVMDTLTAAVREGTAEPNEFADALGRVLPIADQAGISFQAVAASLASMSNAGLDVNEGVTSLRAILQSLVAPTAQTESAFRQMGLSVDDVVNSMQGQGLIATLRLLEQHARAATSSEGEFNQIMRHAIPNIRGLAGAFNLLHQDSAKVDAIFQAVSRSAGALDRAFAITAASDAFKVQQALNQISIEGQKLAADVLPLIVHGLSGLARESQVIVSQWEDMKNSFDLKDVILGGFPTTGEISERAKVLANTLATPFEVASFGLLPKPFNTQGDIDAMNQQIDQVKLMIASSGEDLMAQAKIYDDALASVGGTIDPGNVDDFTNSVRSAITAMKLQEQTAATTGQAMREAASTTKSFAVENAKAALKLQNLSLIGSDAVGYLSNLHDTLDQSDDAAKDFGAAIDDLTSQWQQFHDQAVQSLNFAPGALSDLTSAAQSAQDQLSSLTPPSTDASKSEIASYNQQLSDLGATANVTGEEILNAFQESAKKTKQFGQDLLEISKIGGAAGKALASSLLQSGDVLGAQIIADSPAKLQKQITAAFGKTASMADTLATKLTKSIVGPLNSIVDILTKLAENVWKIDVNGDGVIGIDQHVKTVRGHLNQLEQQKHIVKVAADDLASAKVDKVQGDVDHLVAHHYDVKLGVDSGPAKADLRNFDSTLDTFLSKKRQVIIGVHTKGDSPMPDEALKQHLFDPMKQAGFKRVGDTYTLPLVVGTHTDPTMPPGTGKDGGGQKIPGLDDLRHIEQRQLQVLFDIRKELKSGIGGGGGGTSGTSDGTGGTDGHGRPHGSLSQISPLKDAAAEIVKMTSKSGATLNEGLGVVQRVAAQGLNPAFIRHAVESVRQELGKGAARQYQQQLRLIDQMTKDDAEKRAAARRAAYYAAHPDAQHQGFDPKRFMTPIQRNVNDIFQKIYKSGMTPGEARGVIQRVAREGRDPKFIGGAIKGVMKELGPQAAKEFGHSLRALDASTARNAKHQQDALDAAKEAFQQMTQGTKQEVKQAMKQRQANQEANKQWMADVLTRATKNAPKLPRGHTNISVNHHERGHRKREVTLDRKRFADSAGYEVDYARGF